MASIIILCIITLAAYICVGFYVGVKYLADMSRQLNSHYKQQGKNVLFLILLDESYEFSDNNVSFALFIVLYSLFWPVIAIKTVVLYNKCIKVKQVRKRRANKFINTIKSFLLIDIKQPNKKCNKYFLKG